MRPLFAITRSLGLAFLLTHHIAGQDSEAGPEYDLRLNIRIGEPIAASLKVNMDATVEVTAGGKVTKNRIETAVDLRFVDKYTLLEDGRWDATRTYVRWFATEGNSVVDSELNGVRVFFKLEDERHEIKLDDRLLPAESIDGLLEQAQSVGIWFGLPEAVPIGGEFDIDPTSLLSLLTDAKTELTSADGSFVLRSVDENQVAVLEGRLSAVEEREDMTQSYEGDCTMEVDIPGGRLMRLEWSGTSRMRAGVQGVTMKGSAWFEVKLSTMIGPAAQGMLKRKPVYRNVPRKLPRERLAVELPSHWFHLEGENATQFLTSIHGAEAPVAIEFKVIEIPIGSFKGVVEKAMSDIDEDVTKMSVRNVTSQFGKGRSARYENEGVKFLLEFYPLDNSRLLRLRIFGPPRAFSRELKNWRTIRRTIEELGGK